MNTNPIIEYQATEKYYTLPNGDKTTALKKLDLTIYKGESFGLLGPNGAGKTTAINLLAGVIMPTAGDIKVSGISVKDHSIETKKLLGVVQQELIVDSFFTLPTMLRIQSKLSGVVPDQYWIDFLIEKLQLKDHIKKTTRELSGGMKRRMMIARALVQKPQILVLDEPTAGVDVHLRHSMWEFVRDLHKFGMTVILTTHYLEEAEEFCHRIAIMNRGELLTLKTNKDLLEIGRQPKFVIVFKPNFEISSVTDIPPSLQAFCNERDIKYEINHEEHQTKLILKLEFNNNDVSALQSELAEIQSYLKDLNGTVSNMYTEHTKLEDVFLELTKIC